MNSIPPLRLSNLNTFWLENPQESSRSKLSEYDETIPKTTVATPRNEYELGSAFHTPRDRSSELNSANQTPRNGSSELNSANQTPRNGSSELNSGNQTPSEQEPRTSQDTHLSLQRQGHQTPDDQSLDFGYSLEYLDYLSMQIRQEERMRARPLLSPNAIPLPPPLNFATPAAPQGQAQLPSPIPSPYLPLSPGDSDTDSF